MRIITDKEIQALCISPQECVGWVRQSFSIKYEAQLPPKSSVHPQGIDFFTSMPCLLPKQYDCYGVKVVSRIQGRKPALKSELLLYKTSTGELLALMEADWITQMRTGAVAALAIETLQKKDAQVYSFVGLGSTAHATMMCLQAILPKDKQCRVYSTNGLCGNLCRVWWSATKTASPSWWQSPRNCCRASVSYPVRLPTTPQA